MEKNYDLAQPSFSQERLLFLNQLVPNNVAYAIPVTMKLKGRLDLSALRKAIHEVVNRHETLRTIFGILDKRPMGVVVPLDRQIISVSDLSETQTNHQEFDTLNQMRELIKEPFNLASGPLVKVNLLKTKNDENFLLVNFHHIIVDEWSLQVFFRELKELYEAEVEGRDARLPELPIQYGDYAVWQREWLQGEVLDRLAGYWKQKLEGWQGLELPADRSRPAEQSFKGLTYRMKLSKGLSRRLKEFVRAEGVTMNMLMLAVFDVLLYRYTQQEDIAVGMPIANRNRVELENLIGFFLNTLVIRTDLAGEPTFLELMGRVKETLLEAYEHQDLPFEKLVEVLNPERDLSRTPLFQVMFVMEDASLGVEKMGEVTIQPMRVETGTSKFDLTMFVGEVGEQLEVSLEYSTDLFDAERIERMAGHYQRLLEDIVEHPEKKIWELELLTETEKHQILVEWNDTAADYPKDKCVHQLFEEQVERTPDAVAVVFGEEQLTYRELNERANQLGHYLQKLGVGPEVLVGICVERSLEMIVGLLGILKAGGAYVPLDPSYPRERLKYMLEDTQAPVLLTQATLELDLTIENSGVVYLDRDWEEIARLGSDNPKSDVQPENLIYVIYTSGSTGKPKGAMNIHIGVVNRLLWMRDALGFNATDRILQKTPFSFDVSVWELFLPILTGAVLVFAKPEGHKDPQYLVELIQEVKITALHFVPSMLQVFLEVDNLADRCSSLQRVICSGEALPSILQETYYSRTETKLYNLYGPTEAAVDVTWWACRSADDLRSVPIGKPVANTQIYILDHYFNPAPVGVPGELYIGGVQVGRGYFNKPELTQERFIADPFGSREKGKLYKTGDEVKWLVNGDIEYLGRLDNQVKIRGLRIELGEIEKVISEFEAVKEAVVLTIDNVNKEKSIVAYVVASVTADIRDSLTKHLKAKLPEYMLPSYFSFLDAIPLTPNGKADRKVLLEMNRDSLLYVSSKPYVAPRTRTEQLLAEIWKDVLKIERISAHDNFFELGGHSILLMQVLFRIQKTFQTKMAVRELFEARILSDLAGIIDRTPRNNTQPLEKVSRVLEDVD